MSTADRRAFLETLAKGAVYVAPVIATVAAPVTLVGQGKSSEHKAGATSTTSQSQAPASGPGAPPPWQAPPPGR